MNAYRSPCRRQSGHPRDGPPLEADRGHGPQRDRLFRGGDARARPRRGRDRRHPPCGAGCRSGRYTAPPGRPCLLSSSFFCSICSLRTEIPSFRFTLGPLSPEPSGPYAGAPLAWQFTLLVAAGSLLTLTTPASELAAGMERLIASREARGDFIAGPVAHALSGAPFHTHHIHGDGRPQRGRCSQRRNFDAGGPVRRLRAFSDLAVPLCLAVFRRCDELVVAMEARGYDGGARTSLRPAGPDAPRPAGDSRLRYGGRNGRRSVLKEKVCAKSGACAFVRSGCARKRVMTPLAEWFDLAESPGV